MCDCSGKSNRTNVARKFSHSNSILFMNFIHFFSCLEDRNDARRYSHHLTTEDESHMLDCGAERQVGVLKVLQS